ncbi:hypothetical protein FA13DRAFT_1799262 [Coprinellus micaceus]|uniref:Uncharacterized protein n=1 Tax=Coprinellus micaceus TaxID=71717 RepID=A0A4Y7SKB3_COPMI|nr:hypothetical protein FA13DRAFT_1799262 [Coprinellus micaceus]
MNSGDESDGSDVLEIDDTTWTRMMEHKRFVAANPHLFPPKVYPPGQSPACTRVRSPAWMGNPASDSSHFSIQQARREGGSLSGTSGTDTASQIVLASPTDPKGKGIGKNERGGEEACSLIYSNRRPTTSSLLQRCSLRHGEGSSKKQRTEAAVNLRADAERPRIRKRTRDGEEAGPSNRRRITPSRIQRPLLQKGSLKDPRIQAAATGHSVAEAFGGFGQWLSGE